MLRPLFILIFKCIFGLACFAAPWVVGNQVLLHFSFYKPNLEMLNAVLRSDLTDTAVAIGDCTIYPLLDVANKELYADLRVTGFGGSQVKEWYYLVKNNFENLKKARVVVIGASPPHRFQALHTPYTSFLPYLMSWSDLYEYAHKEKRISGDEALRFALGKLFNSYLSSQTMRFVYFSSFFPNYRIWHDQRSIMREAARVAQRTHEVQESAINPESDLDEYFAKLAEFSKKMDHRLVYLITPRSSWTHDEKYRTDLGIWLKNCKRLGVSCFSMGQNMPDTAFDRNGDGIHMNNPKDMGTFWRNFENEFRKRLGAR